MGRSPGRVRDWVRSRGSEAYRLGKECRVTRTALKAPLLPRHELCFRCLEGNPVRCWAA